MERNIDMKEVSDGKLYTSNDMVKADCGGCEGCSACCHGMGESIVLDPLDIHRLCCGLGADFNGLMVDKIELNIVDCLILPNLKMAGEKEACSFLNKDGRCLIHGFRPGICRLFPLGRIYEDGSFKYFLQVHECPKPDKAKVKVKKWLDTPNIAFFLGAGDSPALAGSVTTGRFPPSTMVLPLRLRETFIRFWSSSM